MNRFMWGLAGVLRGTLQRAVLVSAMAAVMFVPAAEAALIIDNFAPVPGVGPTVALSGTGATVTATRSYTQGIIVGGERDVRVTTGADVPGTTGIVGAADFGGSGPFPGETRGSVAVDFAGSAHFLMQYDGLDNSPSRASGLGLNLAGAGSFIRLAHVLNLTDPFGTGFPDQPLTVTLVDTAGRSAAVTRLRPAFAPNSFPDIDFAFTDFEAANALFNITQVDVIELALTVEQENLMTGGVSFGGLFVDGSPYTPGNSIQAPGLQSVPEPLSLALFGIGLAALGRARHRF